MDINFVIFQMYVEICFGEALTVRHYMMQVKLSVEHCKENKLT